MDVEDIQKRLKHTYPKSKVSVRDFKGTGDHYEVEIIDSQFENLTPLQRHKTVMDIFKEELKSGEIHALSLKIRSK